MWAETRKQKQFIVILHYLITSSPVNMFCEYLFMHILHFHFVTDFFNMSESVFFKKISSESLH